MVLKVLAIVVLVLIVIMVAVAFRSPDFRYERSGLIQAPPEKIYPHLADLSRFAAWSPYEKGEEMKKTLAGTPGEVGSTMAFESKSSGSGSMEILRLATPTEVDLRLLMTKPFVGDNLIQYRLTPEAGGTRFTWTMSGKSGYLSKLMGTFLNLDKLVGGQFEEGIANLKAIVEK